MISIVVPCHNAENYIDQVVEDMKAQTYRDWEMILVSNGLNQEDQIEKINRLVSDDGRMKLIHTESGGVSNARNIGIEEACGEWLCFVDADDRLQENHLQLYLDHADKDTEVLEGGFAQIDINGNRTENVLKTEDFWLDSLVGTRAYIETANKIGNAPWHTLFKTAFLKENKLLFDTRFSMNEDRIFKMQAFRKAKRWQFFPLTGYVYVASRGSAMSKWHANIEESWRVFLDIKDAIKRLSGYGNAEIQNERIRIQYYLVWQYIWNMFKPGCPLSFGEKVRAIKCYINERMFIDSCQEHDWKHEVYYMKFFRLSLKTHSPLLVAFLFLAQHNIKCVWNKLWN